MPNDNLVKMGEFFGRPDMMIDGAEAPKEVGVLAMTFDKETSTGVIVFYKRDEADLARAAGFQNVITSVHMQAHEAISALSEYVLQRFLSRMLDSKKN